MLAISIGVNFIIPSGDNIKVDCSLVKDPIIKNTTNIRSGQISTKYCVLEGEVRFELDGEEFVRPVLTRQFLCGNNQNASTARNISQCWVPSSIGQPGLSKERVNVIRSERDETRFQNEAQNFFLLRIIFYVAGGIFAFLLFFSLFLLLFSSISHYVQSFLARGTRHSRTSTEHGRGPQRPPSTPSDSPQRHFEYPPSIPDTRVSVLIDQSLLSLEDGNALKEEQWSCCICLEEVADGPYSQPIARLKCGHSMHAHCLRTWLSKGRAVCCICNSEVFSDLAADGDESLASSMPFLTEGRPTGSLVVEITEYSPSSPSTSLVAQPASTSNNVETNYSNATDH